MSEGYLNGWLDFTYKNPLSRNREDYILTQVEKGRTLKIAELKTLLEGSLVSGALHSNTIQMAYDDYDKYLGLALPYIDRNRNIKTDVSNKLVSSKEEMEKFKQAMSHAKKIATTEILEK